MNLVPDLSWAIVYIRGAEGFQEDILPKLRDKYLSAYQEMDSLMMIWIPAIAKLRNLKIAIGGKAILKYRLHFSASLNQPAKTPDSASVEFWSPEVEPVSKMTVWQNKRHEQPEV